MEQGEREEVGTKGEKRASIEAFAVPACATSSCPASLFLYAAEVDARVPRRRPRRERARTPTHTAPHHTVFPSFPHRTPTSRPRPWRPTRPMEPRSWRRWMQRGRAGERREGWVGRGREESAPTEGERPLTLLPPAQPPPRRRVPGHPALHCRHAHRAGGVGAAGGRGGGCMAAGAGGCRRQRLPPPPPRPPAHLQRRRRPPPPPPRLQRR